MALVYLVSHERYIVLPSLPLKTKEIVPPLVSCLHLILPKIKSDSELRELPTCRRQPRTQHACPWVPSVVLWRSIEYILTVSSRVTLLQGMPDRFPRWPLGGFLPEAARNAGFPWGLGSFPPCQSLLSSCLPCEWWIWNRFCQAGFCFQK